MGLAPTYLKRLDGFGFAVPFFNPVYRVDKTEAQNCPGLREQNRAENHSDQLLSYYTITDHSKPDKSDLFYVYGRRHGRLSIIISKIGIKTRKHAKKLYNIFQKVHHPLYSM